MTVARLRGSARRLTGGTLPWLVVMAIGVTGMITVYLPTILYEPLHLDSGVFLYKGWTILNGGAPYLDVWDHKGPLLYLFNAAGLLIAEGLAGVYILEAALAAGGLAVALAVLRGRVADPVLALAALAFPVSHAVLFDLGNYSETWQTGFSLIAYALLAAWLFDRAAGREPGGNAARAGVLRVALAIGVAGGVAAMLRPSNGAGLFVAALALLWLARGARLRAGLGILVGGVAVCLPVLAALGLWGVLDLMVEQYLVYNFVYVGDTGLDAYRRTVPILIRYFVQAPLVWMCVLALGLAAIGRLRRPDRAAWVLIAVAAVDFAVAFSAGRPYLHYLGIVPPALFVTAISLWRPVAPGARAPAAVGAVLALLVAGFLVRETAVTADLSWRAGLNNPQSTTARVVERIRGSTEPSDPVLIYGLHSGYLALAGRESPTPYSYILPLTLRGMHDREMIAEYFRDIRASPPALIVRTRDFCPIGRQVCPDDSRYSAPEHLRLGEVRAWIRRNYREAETIGGHTIWERRPDATGG